MLISEILDVSELDRCIDDGYVTVRNHPSLPLRIFNYTAQTQWHSYWNPVTTRCRGLIVDDVGNIIGSGFHKFFNYGQSESASLDTTGPVQVTDKIDGSLAILCFYKNELVVATRGSFESEQAKFAYEHVMNNYYDVMKIICSNDSTALAEIIYPENRIVVDYGDLRDLVLLGVQSNHEQSGGKHLWLPADKIYSWPGPSTQRFECNTFEDALRLPFRDNAEGIVVYFEKTGERLKIKYPDYVRLHKLISNLTPKNIWQSLAVGTGIEELIQDVPDEFHGFVTDIASSLFKKFNDLVSAAAADFNYVLESLPKDWSRKDFAEKAMRSPHRNQLFLMLDGRQDVVIQSIWKEIQPKGE